MPNLSTGACRGVVCDHIRPYAQLLHVIKQSYGPCPLAGFLTGANDCTAEDQVWQLAFQVHLFQCGQSSSPVPLAAPSRHSCCTRSRRDPTQAPGGPVKPSWKHANDHCHHQTAVGELSSESGTCQWSLPPPDGRWRAQQRVRNALPKYGSLNQGSHGSASRKSNFGTTAVIRVCARRSHCFQDCLAERLVAKPRLPWKCVKEV